jgi:hypothetical protein
MFMSLYVHIYVCPRLCTLYTIPPIHPHYMIGRLNVRPILPAADSQNEQDPSGWQREELHLLLKPVFSVNSTFLRKNQMDYGTV